MGKTSEPFTVTGFFKHETPAAILINDGDQDIWLPKSQIDYDGDVGEEIEVEVPMWLAVKADLV